MKEGDANTKFFNNVIYKRWNRDVIAKDEINKEKNLHHFFTRILVPSTNISSNLSGLLLGFKPRINLSRLKALFTLKNQNCYS